MGPSSYYQWKLGCSNFAFVFGSRTDISDYWVTGSSYQQRFSLIATNGSLERGAKQTGCGGRSR